MINFADDLNTYDVWLMKYGIISHVQATAR